MQRPCLRNHLGPLLLKCGNLPECGRARPYDCCRSGSELSYGAVLMLTMYHQVESRNKYRANGA